MDDLDRYEEHIEVPVINDVQELQLKLLEKAVVKNPLNIDVEKIAKSLRDHAELWRGMVITRVGKFELIPLRDIDQNCWNVHTLYLLSWSKRIDRDLEELVKTWGPVKYRWITGKESQDLTATSPPPAILEVDISG